MMMRDDDAGQGERDTAMVKFKMRRRMMIVLKIVWVVLFKFVVL